MEKAILKTLIYADIFDYPLKAYEIHKWLIGRKATLRQVEKALARLSQKSKVKRGKDYCFLPGRNGLVKKRDLREKQSSKFLLKAKIITWFLQLIPWIKLMGISGGLAMENADKADDIDLFIVTSKNRLWISRLLALGLLSIIGQRRKVWDKSHKIAGKLCLNILLEEDRLGQNKRDIYLAHEVLQMKVLWQKDGVYSKYLEDNSWAFKFLPNWTTTLSSPRRRGSNNFSPLDRKLSFRSLDRKLSFRSLDRKLSLFVWMPAFAGMTIENLAKRFQLWYMGKPQGMERIEDGAVYFHPNDIRPQVLKEYKNLLRRTFPFASAKRRQRLASLTIP